MAEPPVAPDQTRWSRVWSRLGGRGNGRQIFEQLAAEYNEPTRTYHNIEHLRHCLTELEENIALAHRPVEVEAALWFHDAVYVPGDPDNEDQSARLAETALRGGGVEPETAAESRRWCWQPGTPGWRRTMTPGSSATSISRSWAGRRLPSSCSSGGSGRSIAWYPMLCTSRDDGGATRDFCFARRFTRPRRFRRDMRTRPARIWQVLWRH